MWAFIHKEDYISPRAFPIAVSQGSSREAEDYTVIDHAHDFEELVAIKRGSGIHIIEGKAYPVQRGDVFFIHKDQHHYFTERRDMEHINIAFDRDDLPLPVQELKQIPAYHALFEIDPQVRKQSTSISHLRLSAREFAEYQSIVREMLEAQEQTAESSNYFLFIALQRILCMLFLAYEQSATQSPNRYYRFAELLSYLESHYMQELTVDQLARQVSMSRSSFTRNFKQATGVSLINYINQKRIEAAQKLMQHSSDTITEISGKVGFEDSNYFSRTFRKLTGFSPSAYRNQFE